MIKTLIPTKEGGWRTCKKNVKKKVNDGLVKKNVKKGGEWRTCKNYGNTNVLFAPNDFKLCNPYDLSKFKS